MPVGPLPWRCSIFVLRCIWKSPQSEILLLLCQLLCHIVFMSFAKCNVSFNSIHIYGLFKGCSMKLDISYPLIII